MSTLLGSDLDAGTLSILLSLTEQGINPEALVLLYREFEREARTNAVGFFCFCFLFFNKKYGVLGSTFLL